MTSVEGNLAEAVRLHREGRYDVALTVLREGGVANTPLGQTLIGDIHLRSGDAASALAAFEEVSRLAPASAEAHNNRSVALLRLDDPTGALAAAEQALRMRPGYAGAAYNCGLALRALGRQAEALAALEAALVVQPGFTAARAQLGMVLLDMNRLGDALTALRSAAAHGDVDALVGQAAVFQRLGQTREALDAVDAALSRSPGLTGAALMRPRLLFGLGRREEALAAATELAERVPNDPSVLLEQAELLMRLGRQSDANEVVDRAVALAPQNSAVWLTRAVIRGESGDIDGAVADVGRALELGADEQTASELADTFKAMAGDPATLLPALNRLITANPLPGLIEQRAYVLLAAGDAGGWQDFESRVAGPTHDLHRIFGSIAPRWQGENLAGKHLVVYSEQGIGDAIHFTRFLKRLPVAGKVTFIVHPPLASLIGASLPNIRVLPDIPKVRDFDYQIALMSLPTVVGGDFDTLGGEVPYLTADAQRMAKWAARVGAEGFRVGLVWQGSPVYRGDERRSIPLGKYAPLASVPGVRLFSVQAVNGLAQLDELGTKLGINRLGPELENNPEGLQEMAAILANLDLLITSDTAPAHLAGALARPTWLALSDRPDWRWMRERQDSPWYPTMRLFRQPSAGDWDSVFAAIAAALEPLATARR